MARIIPVWDRVAVLLAAFPGADRRAARRAAADMSARWAAAFADCPDLAGDIIRQSRLLSHSFKEVDGQSRVTAPTDPLQLAYDQGQRDLALRLLAAGQMTLDDINDLMEASHVSH